MKLSSWCLYRELFTEWAISSAPNLLFLIGLLELRSRRAYYNKNKTKQKYIYVLEENGEYLTEEGEPSHKVPG